MSLKQTLLVVEDEEAIRHGLVDLFTFHGFDVTAVADGLEGLHAALQNSYDCIILDVMLPNMDGFAICNKIRQYSREQAIVMLTAKNSEEDIINGLSLGADDYIAKPFSIRELVLRIECIMRRLGRDQHNNTLVISDDLQIDTNNLTATYNERDILFTRREVELLSFLKQNKYRPVSRQELLHEVWGHNKTGDADTRTVDIHVAKLRKKIEADPKDPQIILTIRGEGYRLVSQ